MRNVLLVCLACLASGCGKMELPSQLKEVDAALREQGVEPKVSSDAWTVKLPPQVMGLEMQAKFIEKYAQSHRRAEYIWYFAVTGHKDGMIKARAVFRTDQTNRQQPEWNIGRLKGSRPEDMAEKFHRVHPMTEGETEEWIQKTLLPGIRNEKFKAWYEEVE